MARFRPSRLFRRFSSRSDGHTTSKSRQHSPSPPNSSAIPSPPLPAYSVPVPRQLQKSSSLPRLRKRSGTQGTAKSVTSGGAVDREREESVPEVPEAIGEGGESLQLASQRSGEEIGSECETASLDKSKSSGTVELAEQKEVVVSTEELRLDEVEKPIVIIEHPTPDVTEEVRGRAVHTSSTSEIQHGQVEQQSAASDSPLSTATDTRKHRPSSPVRRPSIIDSANANIVKALVNVPINGQDRYTSDSPAPPTTTATEYFERTYAEHGKHAPPQSLGQAAWRLRYTGANQRR